MGGFWERMVRTVKMALKKNHGKNYPKFERDEHCTG